MQPSDFITRVTFADGVVVQLGGGTEMYIENEEDPASSAMLDDDRLKLIRLLREAEDEATGS